MCVSEPAVIPNRFSGEEPNFSRVIKERRAVQLQLNIVYVLKADI